MELAKFENGMECHVAVIKDVITRNGIYVQHEKGYSYSVGMLARGFPEVFIRHQNDWSSLDIENKVSRLVACRSLPDLQAKLKSLGFTARVITEIEKRRYFFSARLYFKCWDFNAICLKPEQ